MDPKDNRSDHDDVLSVVALAEAEDARRDLGEHPLPEDLLAYVDLDIEEEKKEAVQEHLAVCPRCVRAVLDLQAFPDVVSVSKKKSLSDREIDAEWRRLSEELKRARASKTPAPQPISRRPAVSRGVGLALAASLVIAVLGLGWWSIHPSQPRVNVFIAELTPGSLQRGQEERIRPVAGTEHLLFILNLQDLRVFPAYRVTIVDDEQREVWSSDEIRRSREGNFNIELDRRRLPDGVYRITVAGIQDSRAQSLASYAVKIEYEQLPGSAG